VRPQAEAKGLTLVMETPPDARMIRSDAGRLRKIAHHLVGNAVKFTERGGVSVRLEARGAGASQRMLLTVRDTGIGIPPEAQARLFTRFSQGDDSATRRFGGSGLGLAICRKLADLMGATISFESAVGEGSTFRMDFPAPACDATGAPDPHSWLAGLRVLVVEDNPTNRLVATTMLGQLGAQVDTAEDGAEGVAAVESRHYDLIFMDIQMPVMDGVEAARRIRAMGGDKGAIPIVATTANVMPEQLATYRRSGINGVVAKPISPTSLLAEVARIANDDAPATEFLTA